MTRSSAPISDGILTAASLMVSGAAAADAVRRARAMPSLRVGLHLVLVEGKPVLPAAAVPDLVDASGNFRTDMARAGAAMFFLPKVRRQLEAEIEAQFAAFDATGLTLDHVNAHKHFHLHPTIAALIVKLGKTHGVQGRAGAAGAAGACWRGSNSISASGAVALTAPFARALAQPFPPRRHRRARSGVRPGLVGRDDAARGWRA